MTFLTFLTFVAVVAGCAHSTIIPFQPSSIAAAKTYPPTLPAAVGIYRSEHPFDSFEELGLITFRTGELNLPKIYEQLRRDSALQGAEAVVDVMIKGETHTESKTVQECTPHTDCDADGKCETHQDCTTKWVDEEVTTFLIEGSMIRKKPEVKL